MNREVDCAKMGLLMPSNSNWTTKYPLLGLPTEKLRVST